MLTPDTLNVSVSVKMVGRYVLREPGVYPR